jgi:hypothetical protein
MKNGIIFQGVLLAPGSLAHKLHTEKKWKELEAHMKALDQKKRQLEGKTNG